jgi:hypothetical protein
MLLMLALFSFMATTGCCMTTSLQGYPRFRSHSEPAYGPVSAGEAFVIYYFAITMAISFAFYIFLFTITFA